MAVIIDANTGRAVYKAGIVKDGDFIPSTLSYEELADLAQRARSGDAPAAIAFDRLNKSEKRLAAELLEIYGTRITKSKKGKAKSVVPTITKREKQDIMRNPSLTAGDLIAAELFKVLRTADNGSDREAARDVLHKAGRL